jgi:hypothetical protein
MAAIGYSAVPAKDQSHRASEARVKIAENECLSKGGIGIINTSLYIDLKSKGNELILSAGKRWTGAASTEKQIVFVWEQKVFDMADAPRDFKLESSAIVSFEGTTVSFFDFKSGIGGFYRRGTE